MEGRGEDNENKRDREKHTIVIGPRLQMTGNLRRFERKRKRGGKERRGTNINQMLSLKLGTDTSIIINIKKKNKKIKKV